MRRRIAAVVAAGLVWGASVQAAPPIDGTAESAAEGGTLAPAQAGSRGVRTPVASQALSVAEYGAMRPATIERAEAMALALGVPSARGRSFASGVTAVWRGDTAVQDARRGTGRWQFPVSVTALPPDALGVVMGPEVSAAVAGGGIVLSASGAALRTAIVGDELEFVRGDGATVRLRVGAVLPDSLVAGSEIVMSNDHADLLGATTVTRVMIFGRFVRADVEAALPAWQLTAVDGVRVTRSSDGSRNPDAQLGSVRTKTLLGDFSYRVNGNRTLSLDPAWVADNISDVRFTGVPIRASCHKVVVPYLQAALTEVAEADLGALIDVADTNTTGGCFNPRFAVASVSVGSVSRHAWGMAFDLNVRTNPQGRAPRLDCRIVRIFRKHGFIWGGNFFYPDGMHFEWVGEPRHDIIYPSTYCPNLPGGAITG